MTGLNPPVIFLIMSPRELLNKLKWTNNPHLEKVKIWYVHRGAPNNINIVNGSEIKQLKHFAFVTNFCGSETHIPYHRITKITLDDAIIYQQK